MSSRFTREIGDTQVPIPDEYADDPPADWVRATPAEWHAAALARDHYHSALAMLKMAGEDSRGGPPRTTGTSSAYLLARADTHLQAASFCAQAAAQGIDLRVKGEKLTPPVPEAGMLPELTHCSLCDHPYAVHQDQLAGTGPHPDITRDYRFCRTCQHKGIGACR